MIAVEDSICTNARTGVNDDTFNNVFTLTYFGPFVFIQALSGHFTRQCHEELIALFRTKPHLSHYWYIRKKRGRFYVFKKPIYPNSPELPGLFIFQE